MSGAEAGAPSGPGTRAVREAARALDRVALQGLGLVVVMAMIVGSLGVGALTLLLGLLHRVFPPETPPADESAWPLCLTLGCMVLAAVVLMPPGRSAPPLLFATKDARIWRLVQRRAEHFGTHPPANIYVTLEPTIDAGDFLAAFWGRARRRLEITPALLAPEAERLLTTEIDRQLAYLAGSTRGWADVRAHWVYALLAAGRDRDLPTDLSKAPIEVNLFVRLADFVSRCAILPAALVMRRRTVAARGALDDAAERYLAERYGEASDGAAAVERTEQLVAYVDALCRPLVGLELLPTNALRGFETWQKPDEPRLDEVAFTALDDLARALSVEAFDDPDRPRLTHASWHALTTEVIVDRLRARAAAHLQSLPQGRDIPHDDPTAMLGWVLAELDARRGEALAVAVDPRIPQTYGPLHEQRIAYALWALLESAFANMLLSRGATLEDPFRAKVLALSLHGESFPLHGPVQDALASTEGRVRLRELMERAGEKR